MSTLESAFANGSIRGRYYIRPPIHYFGKTEVAQPETHLLSERVQHTLFFFRPSQMLRTPIGSQPVAWKNDR